MLALVATRLAKFLSSREPAARCRTSVKTIPCPKQVILPRHLRPDHYRRPADYRWQTAMFYAEADQRVPRRYSNPWIALAVKLARALEDKKALARFEKRHPELIDAWEVYREGGVCRWELEARLLANEAPESISKKMCLPVKSVQVYAEIFFHIQDRLNSPSHIATIVIGDRYQFLKGDDHETLWKMFGYWCGPMMLDLIVYQFQDAKRPSTPGEVLACCQQQAGVMLHLKQMLAIHLLPLDDPKVAVRLMRLSLRIEEFEQRRKQRQVPAFGVPSFSANVEAFRQNLDASLQWPEQLRGLMAGFNVAGAVSFDRQSTDGAKGKA